MAPVSNIQPITDPDDARTEPFRAVQERDLVGRQGKFVAEGEVVLRALLGQRRFGVESVLVSERRLAGSIGALLDLLPPDIPVYAAVQAVMDSVTGFHLHRGVLAIGLRGEPITAETLLASLPRDALVVAAIGIANHDNVGGIFRNAAAFGAAAVLLDETSCDPLYRKAIRVSVGACLSLPWARGGSGAELIGLLRQNGFTPLALSPSGADELAEVARPRRPAIIVGAEGPGLSAEILAATRTVRIGMAGGFDSLNVATACAVALYHFSR